MTLFEKNNIFAMFLVGALTLLAAAGLKQFEDPIDNKVISVTLSTVFTFLFSIGLSSAFGIEGKLFGKPNESGNQKSYSAKLVTVGLSTLAGFIVAAL